MEWNIIWGSTRLNFRAFIVRGFSRNLVQHLILARKGQKSPYSISFLIVLHQNKSSHHFCKRGQCLIVKPNIGLEYALNVQHFHMWYFLFSEGLWYCHLWWLLDPYNADKNIEFVNNLEHLSLLLFEWLIDNYMKINAGKSHLIVSRNVKDYYYQLIRIIFNLKKNKCRVLTSSERYRIMLFSQSAQIFQLCLCYFEKLKYCTLGNWNYLP